ncbi:MAG: MarR family transcriptional regulator [Gammaproteobacteria bacterium]|nr:MarR family transcriptional regulator [Gammaproteobacteria bacterium]
MKRHDQVLISLRRIIRAIDLHSKRLERESGLTGPQLLLLRLVANTGQLTAGVIAREVSLSQATVTAIIDRLEQKGLLQRLRNTEDKRKVMLSLTSAGKAALEQAPPLLQESFITRFDRLEEWEQSLILSSLQRLGEMMNANDLDAAPLLDSSDAQLIARKGM